MKSTTLTLLALLLLSGLESPAQTPPRPGAPPAPAPASGATAGGNQAGYNYNWTDVDLNQVLDVYSHLVGRTILRPAGLSSPPIVLQTESPLTKQEAIEALQGVLALNNIVLVNVGDKFVKAVPVADAAGAAGKFSEKSAAQLPDVGQYMTKIVHLQYVQPSKMVQLLQPFAKLPNGLFAIDDNNILVIRDYAENVKRMLELIKQIDVNVPEEFVSAVIPIKYAMVDDIANALNALGGSSSSIGNATTPSNRGMTTPGARGFQRPGYNNNSMFNQNQVRPYALVQPMAVRPATPPASTFSQRLRNIISRAAEGGQGQIQILGPTKIIADERSNSLLVFASKQDMKTIKDIVSKLDVLLPQVLIESVIMDVSLNKAWNFGVSAAQNPKRLSSNPNIQTAGGYNNGQSFLDFVNSSLGTNSGSVFGNNLGNGLSYFGNIGPTWDLALQAAANDNNVTIIQRPRVQTFQAKEAQFFVGESVPYLQNTYYGGSYYGGNSTYGQLQVGVTLDVTPFINPNGLVVMDISEEIDDLISSTGPNGELAPTTSQRSLNSEVAVKDRDTIILGGFIKTDQTRGKKGVPLLQDIPLLGNLFSSRSSSKDRSELLVLLRPTVLATPELAAAQVSKEEQRLPGITRAAAEEKGDENTEMQKVHARLQREHATLPSYTREAAPGGTSVNIQTNPPPPSNPPAGAVHAVRQYESATNLPPARP